MIYPVLLQSELDRDPWWYILPDSMVIIYQYWNIIAIIEPPMITLQYKGSDSEVGSSSYFPGDDCQEEGSISLE